MEWLQYMYVRNKSYEALGKVGYTDADFKALKLPIFLPKRVGVSLYRRLRVVNSLFHPVKNNVVDPTPPRVTHQDILSAFCPYVSKYYRSHRKSFELPDYPGLIPFNIIYSESLRDNSVAKKSRRASLMKRASVAREKSVNASAPATPIRQTSTARSPSPMSPSRLAWIRFLSVSGFGSTLGRRWLWWDGTGLVRPHCSRS